MPRIETPDKAAIHYLDEGPRGPTGILLSHASPLNSNF